MWQVYYNATNSATVQVCSTQTVYRIFHFDVPALPTDVVVRRRPKEEITCNGGTDTDTRTHKTRNAYADLGVREACHAIAEL